MEYRVRLIEYHIPLLKMSMFKEAKQKEKEMN